MLSFVRVIARFARINATLPSGLSGSYPHHNVARHWTSASATVKSAYRTNFCPSRPYYLAENEAAPDAMSSRCVPCYLANLAAFCEVSRDEKDELQMTWQVMWQKSTVETHLKAPLKPIVGINHGRKRPRILTNDKCLASREKQKKRDAKNVGESRTEAA
jgi:hypothetical protein